MFSRACEYAIKIMIFIAANEQEGKRTSLKDVTEAIASPEAFTAKILQQLVRGGLLASFRGPGGGFVLPADKEVLLHDIVVCIDGERLLKDCVLGLPNCSSANPCPVHDKFIEVRNMLVDTLLSTQVKDPDLLEGSRVLKK